MELAKNERVNALLEFYHLLLTKKQDAYIELYYADDLSLGEIAEQYQVSRQAVYDNIKRTEKTLSEYEDKLHLYAEFIARNEKIDELQDYVEEHYSQDEHLKKLLDAVRTLEEQ